MKTKNHGIDFNRAEEVLFVIWKIEEVIFVYKLLREESLMWEYNLEEGAPDLYQLRQSN